MKRVVLSVMILLLVLSVPALAAQKGPIAEKIYFDVRMQQDIGIQDVAQGKSDIFYYGVNGSVMFGLDQDILNKLDIYAVPSGSWSLIMNPVPNKAPYTWKVDGVEQFNPFAIREVRFAMNYLINRQYIVDEILAGAGGPMFTMATPGQPGTYKYNLIASKMGLTNEGDEARAIADITAAMNKAAQLPENKGRLAKKGDFWQFDGKDVVLKIMIRVDDPTGRLKEGEYLYNQIEKAGIKVEKLMWDRVKCINTLYGGDPAKLEWHMYTEGWGAGATRAWWDNIIAQMYAPWYTNMPGWGEPGFWSYENKELDDLSIAAYSGQILTEQEYWDKVLRAQELGLYDAVRIYVAYQTDFYVANKANYKERFAYGLGDGLNKASLVTSDTKNKVVRASQFSAQGGLFMDAWDPIGADGFDSVYSNYIAEPLYDPSVDSHPATAALIPNRAIALEYDTKVIRDKNGELAGQIAVPATAQKYDPIANKWVNVGEGVKAMSYAKYKFRWSNFHQGIPMSLVDYIYANAFDDEWISEDQPGDPWYDSSYSSSLGPDNGVVVGTIYNFDDNTITVYLNYNFPPEPSRVAYAYAPGISVSSSGHPVAVSWEIDEALARMVAQGSVSGKVYSFAMSKPEQVDVLTPSCVKDIKAELQKMKSEKYVPASLKGFVTAEDAAKRYDAAIRFIDKYGHAYISNGPYMLTKFDNKTSYAVLQANRDASYPFTSDFWINEYKTNVLSVDKVDFPTVSNIGKDIKVQVTVSEITYPFDTAVPAKNGSISVVLITDKELKFEAKAVADGVFEAVIPASVTKGLKAGSYTVLAMASAEGVVPATVAKVIVIR